MAYKISLITPVYNAEDTLPRAFESARAQTLGFENIEYILVDDASADGSWALIEGLAARYPNVTALRREANSGGGGAPRNMALDTASAPYIMFLDSDDTLFPGACRALYEAAERTGADIVSGLRGEDDESRRGREAAKRLCENADERLFSLAELESLRGDAFSVFGADFCQKIYRRGIIDRSSLRFAEGGVFEDLVFLLIYLAACSSGALVMSDVFSYTQREGSISHSRGLYYYETIPKAAMWGLDKARALGVEKRYAGYIEQQRCIEWYCECLCRDEEFSRDELAAIIAAWQPLLRYAAEHFIYDAPEAELITRALVSRGREGALEELTSLRVVYKKLTGERERALSETRGHYERQLGDIFSSTTWRLARAAQRLAFWKK